jgi:hypothetical protein
MRIGIELNNRAEGDAITRAIDDPVIKTTALVSGALLELTLAQRRAVISFLLATIARDEAPAPSQQLRLYDATGTSGE